MGQKSNPISLRLEKTNQQWSNCWYGDYNYAAQLLQDCTIKTYFQNCSQQIKSSSPTLSLKHQRNQLQIALFSPRPTLTLSPTLRTLRTTNRNRATARTPVWHAREKEKRKAVDALNQHLSASSKRRALVNLNSWLSQVPGKPPVWGQLSTLLLASQLKTAWPCVARAGVLLEEKSQNSCPYTSQLRSKRSARAFLQPLVRGLFHRDTLLTNNASVASFVPWKEMTQKGKPNSLTLSTAGQSAERIGGQTDRTSRAQNKRVYGAAEGLLVRGNFAHFGNAKMQATQRLQPQGRVALLRNPLKTRFESSISALVSNRESGVGSMYWCKIHLFNTLSTYCSPFFIASRVVFLLQQRVPFRQIKTRLISELIQERGGTNYMKGMRISCSGRVAARSKKAQKARTDSIQWGETKLNAFSELVHFASKSAQTTYGKLGVKVWVCYSTCSLSTTCNARVPEVATITP